MEQEKNIITKDGLQELKDELKKLVEIERPQVIEDIKDARNQGDLSENAEFDAAREKQGQIEDRIAEIESIIENSTVATASSRSTKVRIGSEVTVENTTTKEKDEYTIVGTLEADPFQGKISNVSPLGTALLNHEEGDEVQVSIDSKHSVKKFTVKITKIKNN